MHECTCRICGKTFYANNKRQVICSKECKKIANREGAKKYQQRHSGEIRKRQQLKRERKKLAAVRKPDTIIGEGYAERQMARSLEIAGKINTEL